MNRKGAFQATFAMTPAMFWGVLGLAFLLLFLFGFFARFAVGLVLFIIGIFELRRKKDKWIPYTLIGIGAVLMVNPFDLLDGLMVVR